MTPLYCTCFHSEVHTTGRRTECLSVRPLSDFTGHNVLRCFFYSYGKPAQLFLQNMYICTCISSRVRIFHTLYNILHHNYFRGVGSPYGTLNSLIYKSQEKPVVSMFDAQRNHLFVHTYEVTDEILLDMKTQEFSKQI